MEVLNLLTREVIQGDISEEKIFGYKYHFALK